MKDLMNSNFEQLEYIKTQIEDKGDFTWNILSCKSGNVLIPILSNLIDSKEKINAQIPLSIRLGLRSN
jgi:hypothetical protein